MLAPLDRDLLLLLLLVLAARRRRHGLRAWSHGKLEDFKRIRHVRSGGRDAKLVSRREGDFRGLKAQFLVDNDLEYRAGLFDFDHRWAAQIAVWIIAVAKGEAVNIGVLVVSYRAIVEKAANASALNNHISATQVKNSLDYGTHSSTMSVDSQDESVKFSDSVDARRANVALAVFDIPYLKIAAASFWTTGSELEFRVPARL